MKVSTQTTHNCAVAKECEERGDFEGAWTIIQAEMQRLSDLTLTEQANVLLRAGSVAGRTGLVDRDEAMSWARRSLALFDSFGDNEGAASACYALALTCRMRGAFSEAHTWLDAARNKVRTEDTHTVCKIELLRGLVMRDEGRWREALAIYLSVSPLLEVSTDHNLKAKFHGELAVLRRKLATTDRNDEQYDLALLEYTAASYHHEQAGDYRSAAIVLNNAAFLLFKLGRYGEALTQINEAIRIFKALKDRHNFAQAKETKSEILFAQGFYAEAEAEARESVAMLRIGGERAQLTESLLMQGRCLARLGYREKALQTFNMAQGVAEYIEFNHGLGLISLTILEEIASLDIDIRKLHHNIVREKLDTARDAELANRHAECIRSTVEQFKTEMGQDESGGQFFKEGFSLDAAMLAFERELIVRAMEEAEGCQKEAARLLGISASNLNSKLKHQHKAIKHLQTYGHYRGVKRLSHIDTRTMPNDALSGLGVNEGDELVLKKGCRIGTGDVVLIRSRGKLYIGIYGKEPGKAILSPANSEYATWEIEEGAFEFESKVVGYIPRDEVGAPAAKVRTFTNASSARLPAS